MRGVLLRSILFLTFLCAVLHAELVVENGKRIIFIGDGVTHTSGYVSNVQMLALLRDPGSTLTVINSGIFGDTVADAIYRLDSDILPQRPDIAVVMFGLNDVGRNLYKTVEADAATQAERDRCFQKYCEDMETLTSRLTAAGIKVVLATPSCYDQYREAKEAEVLAGCNDPGLTRFAEFVREFAKKKGFFCVEIHAPMTEIAKQYTDFSLCTKDRLHPGPAGGLLIAILMARNIDVSPQIASVTIDGEKVSSQGATVSGITRNGAYLKFTYSPEALPLSLKINGYAKLDGTFSVQDAINLETLAICGLPNGSYTLLTNGKEVAIFNAKELAAGVNLALLETPSAAKSAEMNRLAQTLGIIRQRQRLLVFCDMKLRHLGLTPGENKSSDIKALEKWAEEQKNIKSAQELVAFYQKEVEHREQLEKNAQDTLQKMRAIRPEPFTIEIVPASN